jgi:hypothetical protein
MSTRPVQLIREEIGDLAAYVANLPGPLREGPYGSIYGVRLGALYDELSEAELMQTAIASRCPAIDLRVNGNRTAGGSIHAQFLGDLLQRWQALFSAVAQAATGKPTNRGVIPADILEQSALMVTAFAEGSFVTRLLAGPSRQIEIATGPTLALRAFDDFERLHAAGSNHHELSLQLHRMKGRVLSSYARLLQLVEAWDSTLTVRLADPEAGDVRRAGISPNEAREILPILREVGSPEESSRMAVVGLLNAAHKRTGTFEIDLGEEGTMSGRVSESANLDGVVIGRRYEFIVAEVMTTDPITGIVDTSLSLVGQPRDLSGSSRGQSDIPPGSSDVASR